MGVRILGLFMLFPVMSVYASNYDLNSVFLLTIFVAIIWWFLMITLPQKVETLEE